MTGVPPAVRAVHARALAAGLVDGLDVVVDGITPTSSSECVVLTADGAEYAVLHRDMDTDRPLLRTPSLVEAADVLLEEASWLAADRGRGRYAGRRRPTGGEGWSTAERVAAYERRVAAGPGTAPPAPRP